MDAESAGCAGYAVDLCEEAQTLLARRSNAADLPKKAEQFRMLVRPGLCADVRPQLRFPRFDNVHADLVWAAGRDRLHGPIKDAADLDWPVVARAEQFMRGNAGQRTDFVECRRAALEKEALDGFHRSSAQFLKQAKAETLGNRRIDAVEDGVRSSALDPFRAAFGEEPPPGRSELCARVAFGSFQASR